MSKFLKLVQENTPGEEDGKGPYTVEYKDMKGNVLAKLTIQDDVGASYDNFLKFAEVVNGDLEVVSELPVEDDELKDKIENITAIMNLPDQGILGQVMSPAARSLQMAKRNFAKGPRNMSKKFLDASK